MASISATSYGALRTCPRLYYYEQVLYMQRVREDGARAFGTLFHKGLESWWAYAGEGDAPWADQDTPLVKALCALGDAAKHADTDPYERAAAHAMLVAYHATWSKLVYTRIGVGVEDWYDVPLRDPDGSVVGKWRMIGRKDAIVQFADKHRASVVEHKTTRKDITFGSPYWERITVDTQSSMYIDSARAANIDAVEVLYDVARRPDVSPELATPPEKREYTKGKGCKSCGGSAGGKAGIKQGSGKIKTPHPTDESLSVESDCADCNGTGWKLGADGEPEAPRLYARQRETDESPDEYGRRVADEIAKMPDAHFKQATVLRTDEQIAEARADLVCATIEIDNFYARARTMSNGDLTKPLARQCFPRNTNTCLNVYGRRCDWLDVCNGTVPDPAQSQLYRIKPRRSSK